MYLSRVELGPRAAESAAFWREVSKPYGAHQLLWKLLSRGPEQKRDFLFRAEESSQRRGFLVLSPQPPRDDEGLWTVESKPFAPKLRAGQMLGYRLRASPVVRRKGARHDVVMDRKKLLGESWRNLDEPSLIQAEGAAWLERQASKSGFKLVETEAESIDDDGLLAPTEEKVLALRVDGYQQHRLAAGPKRSSPIRFSTLELEGQLEITDPDLFLQRVHAGFGPQKAFGCGLMLLRRR